MFSKLRAWKTWSPQNASHLHSIALALSKRGMQPIYHVSAIGERGGVGAPWRSGRIQFMPKLLAESSRRAITQNLLFPVHMHFRSCGAKRFKYDVLCGSVGLKTTYSGVQASNAPGPVTRKQQTHESGENTRTNAIAYSEAPMCSAKAISSTVEQQPNVPQPKTSANKAE